MSCINYSVISTRELLRKMNAIENIGVQNDDLKTYISISKELCKRGVLKYEFRKPNKQ